MDHARPVFFSSLVGTLAWRHGAINRADAAAAQQNITATRRLAIRETWLHHIIQEE
jgi:hypothetical protein